MIVMLKDENADEGLLRAVCESGEARCRQIGLILAKEGPEGGVVFWDTFRPKDWKSYDKDAEPLSFMWLGRLNKARRNKGGQLALWLSSDFDWKNHPVVSKILSQNGVTAHLPDGQRISIDVVLSRA